MAASDAIADLGPLPVADRQNALERLSLVALSAALPTDKFKIRDERTDDAGVDASLELLINSYSTNLRAQVQLKATDQPRINTDGSISLQVDTSNLNYLLNGQSPLYILFVASSRELRFAWARDERKRLDKQNPNWMQQKTVTLRFEHLLKPEALDSIHKRIRQEAQLQRHIHDVLGRVSTTEQVVISIDPTTLSNTDPDEICNLLMVGGATVISSGSAALVLRLFDIINPASSRTPRLEMIRSFAYYSLGKYQSALGHATEALLRRDELSSDDQQFVNYLKDACAFHCGSIDLTEYSQRQEARASQQSGLFALMYRLDYVRHTFSAEKDSNHRRELYLRLRSIVDSILSFPNGSHQSRLQARLTLLHAEGAEAVSQLLHELGLYNMRLKMGYPADARQYVEVLDKRFGQWERDMESVLQEATRQLHPILMGDALNTWVGIRVFKLSTLRAMPNLFDEIPEAVIYANMSEAEQSVRLHSASGSLEGELSAKMLLADLFELANQDEAAKAIAEGILPKAQAMNYYGLEMRAKAHISGETLLAIGEARRKEIESTDQDSLISERSDDEMRQAARSTLEAIGLPDDRLPALERGWLAERGIAQERLNWCQYIELLEQLGHRRHIETTYQTDPNRHCFCQKYGYEFAFGNTDWKTVIQAFKQTFCKGCPSRSPKQTPN